MSTLALEDWILAEKEYLAQRPADGSIPRKQLWREDTIERRAYEIWEKRIRLNLPRIMDRALRRSVKVINEQVG